MYEFIRGKVHTALPGMAVLDVGGVGYRVLVPISTSSRLKPGTEATLLIYHTINAEQGEERLFGFHTEEERRLFRALLEVKGIGPATALQVLCAADADRLIELIANADLPALKKFKGIGPKTAERIITELRDKVAPWGKGAISAPTGAAAIKQDSPAADAVLALVALGYPAVKSEEAVRKSVAKVGETASTEDIVRRALQLV
jgi:Holliday junction DNA helicase RuvA